MLSGVADAVELYLFDQAGAETRLPLEPGDGDVWQGHVPGVGHRLRYGVPRARTGALRFGQAAAGPVRARYRGRGHLGPGGARAGRGLRPVHAALRRARGGNRDGADDNRSWNFFGPGHVQWLRPDGSPMDAGDWSNPDARAVTVAVADGALLVNAWWEPLTFRLPREGRWSVELDTADPGSRRVVADTVELPGRSLALVSASS